MLCFSNPLPAPGLSCCFTDLWQGTSLWACRKFSSINLFWRAEPINAALHRPLRALPLSYLLG